MYEREGLLRPARTEGNTRLYDNDTIERLEIILTLTRHLGVNLAGVDVILHMKQRMEKMQGEVQKVLQAMQEEAETRRPARGSDPRPGPHPGPPLRRPPVRQEVTAPDTAASGPASRSWLLAFRLLPVESAFPNAETVWRDL